MLKILLPTDFSRNSMNAIRFAMNFYENRRTVFYLLNCYLVPAGAIADHRRIASGQSGPGNRNRADSSAALERLKEELETEFNNSEHELQVCTSSNRLKDEIAKVALEKNIDIIVMATQGATGAKAIFMGTKTTQVLKIANCPVLVVPSQCVFEKPKNVAFVTTFKRNFSADILAPLGTIVSLFHPALRIMNINEKKRLNTIEESNKNTLERYTETYNSSWHWMPYFSTKTDSIKVFIKELHIDFLVMIRYKHNYLEGLLREPVIKKMGFGTDVPFLIIPFDD